MCNFHLIPPPRFWDQHRCPHRAPDGAGLQSITGRGSEAPCPQSWRPEPEGQARAQPGPPGASLLVCGRPPSPWAMGHPSLHSSSLRPNFRFHKDPSPVGTGVPTGGGVPLASSVCPSPVAPEGPSLRPRAPDADASTGSQELAHAGGSWSKAGRCRRAGCTAGAPAPGTRPRSAPQPLRGPHDPHDRHAGRGAS